MSLLSLPSEILLLIFDHLTPKYLSSNPDILYISRKWHTYAHFTVLKSPSIVSKNLSRFPPENAHTYSFLKSHTTSVSLKLSGPIDYTTPLKSQLSKFSASLKALRRLQAFSFAACYRYDPSEPPRSFDYLDTTLLESLDYLWDESVFTLVSSLPQQTLTTLELDTIGSSLITGMECYLISGKPRPKRHICTMFKEFVALRVLKVRMEFMCEEVFNVGEGSRVEEIVVSLRAKDQDGKGSRRNCVPCFSVPGVLRGLDKRLVQAGGEAMGRSTWLKRCMVLGQVYDGKVFELDCDTRNMRIYKDCDEGWTWGKKGGVYESGWWSEY